MTSFSFLSTAEYLGMNNIASDHEIRVAVFCFSLPVSFASVGTSVRW